MKGEPAEPLKLHRRREGSPTNDAAVGETAKRTVKLRMADDGEEERKESKSGRREV